MSKYYNEQTDEFFDGEYWLSYKDTCQHCADQCREQDVPFKPAELRLSLGIYAGRYCDECWEKSGFRKEGYEGYSYLDAGEEYYEDE